MCNGVYVGFCPYCDVLLLHGEFLGRQILSACIADWIDKMWAWWALPLHFGGWFNSLPTARGKQWVLPCLDEPSIHFRMSQWTYDIEYALLPVPVGHLKFYKFLIHRFCLTISPSAICSKCSSDGYLSVVDLLSQFRARYTQYQCRHHSDLVHYLCY